MHLVDTHVHLTFEPLCDRLAAVLDRSREAGVTRWIVPAYACDSWGEIENLAATTPGVRPALGLHPWVAHHPLDLAELRDRLKDCSAAAVGEIGLDRKIEAPSLVVQERVFRDQVRVARELDLPLILHDRGAADRMIAILREEYGGEPVRGVLHAFSKGPELAARFLELGLHLGFGGAVTRPGARARRSAAAAPLERIVLETDAPGLGLEGVPAGRSEPRHVLQVCEALAETRGMVPDDVADVTSVNARTMFGIS